MEPAIQGKALTTGQSVMQLGTRVDVWIGLILLASCLAFFWFWRRAKLGTSTDRDSTPGLLGPRNRDFVIAGLLIGPGLMAAGGYVALSYGIPPSIPLFAASFGIVLSLSALNRRHRHSSAGLRRTIDFANSALNASLLAGILIVINVIAFRYGGQPLDLTRERVNSLSSQTLNQLTSLHRPLTFTLVFGQGLRARAQRERVLQLLEMYRAVKPSTIKVASVPNPFRAEETLKRAPDLAILQGGGVLIEYGEGDQSQAVVVRNRDMFPPPPPSGRPRGQDDRFELAFTGEDAITSALIRLREAKKAKVAFTTGHGEPSINDMDPRGDGLGVWKARLSAVGCDVAEVDLIREELPKELSLLVVTNPKSAFKPDEVAKIKSFADQKGPMLVILGNGASSGLEDLLRSYHVELGKGTATDLRLNLNGVPQVVFAVPQKSTVHPIVDGFRARRILIPEGAPIHIGALGVGAKPSQSPPADPNLVATPILRTGPESWAEVDRTATQPKFDRGTDEAGPVVVGAAVAERVTPGSNPDSPADSKGRLVLFSSRAIAGNLVVEIENTNLDLVMNAASWLRDRPDAVGISPNTHVALRLTADPALRVRLVVVPTVVAVLLILGTGIALYIARRE